MEINNPQLFNHIIELGNSIIRPEVLTQADYLSKTKDAKTVAWKSDALNKYFSPQPIIELGGGVVQPEELSPSDYVAKTKDTKSVAWKDLASGKYLAPPPILEIGGADVEPEILTPAQFAGKSFEAKLLTWKKISSGGYFYSPPVLDGSLKMLGFKKIDIGVWDMLSTLSIFVAHPLGAAFANIVSVSVIIFNDAGTVSIPLNSINSASVPPYPYGSLSQIDATQIQLSRTPFGAFTSTDYDDVGVNRGYIFITYFS